MKTVVHVTHEAVQKIGGIGAVLHGLITSKTYRSQVGRDILLGPLFATDGPAQDRLHGAQILYSGLDGLRNTTYANDFARIEHDYGIKIIYGKRIFNEPLTGVSAEAEVILIDVRHYNIAKLDALKFHFFQNYGIESSRYEHIWDYEQYCRIAEPGLEAIRAIGGCENGGNPILLSHEYMGMPTALCALSKFPGQFRTIFYAHEVATMRRIIEEHPGHDAMFYNVLEKAQATGQYVEDVFGSQMDFYKHPLIEASRFCDNIFAVGDYVVKELRFLRKEFKDSHIDLAYNGVSAGPEKINEKSKARAKLQHYALSLLGFKPDYLLTHVTRLVPSKGLWRDLLVVEQLEKHLTTEGTTAILFVFATETGARSSHDVVDMERNYGWPVAHREGHTDLTGNEAAYYATVQAWNAKARFCKIIYINQFLIDAASIGSRAPADIELSDFRKGSDAEFGQSIYEPFGIAQIEPLPFGGICVFTSLCGCAGFVFKAADNKPTDNAIPVDYTQLPDTMKSQAIPELLRMTSSIREKIEANVSRDVAAELFKRLPRTPADYQSLIASGEKLGEAMNWDAVAKNYVLPGMDYALKGAGGALV
jgi:hypothetical protein